MSSRLAGDLVAINNHRIAYIAATSHDTALVDSTLPEMYISRRQSLKLARSARGQERVQLDVPLTEPDAFEGHLRSGWM
jgi:hypothetical protein